MNSKDEIKAFGLSMFVLMTLFTFVTWFLVAYFIPTVSSKKAETTVPLERHEEKALAEIRHQIELLLTAQSIVMCESSGKHNVWGDRDKKYPAYGIGQFQERTFYWLANAAGFKKMDWKNVNDQLKLLLWAIDNGYAGLWTCYHKVKA